MRRCRSPIAIDFGEHRVKALQLQRCGERLQVAACAFVDVGPAATPARRREQWIEAGQRALRAAPFRGSKATVALRLDDVETRHVRIAYDAIDRAGELIAAKVQEPPGPATEVSICPLPISDLFEHGERKREYLCCIAPQPAIDELVALCEALRVQPTGIDLAPIAQARALLHGREGESFVHVDFGKAQTRVAIVRAGEPVLLRCVAVGGDALRECVETRLQLPLTALDHFDAEVLADPVLAAAIVDAIAEPLEPLIRRIGDGMRYCGTLFHGRALASLHATGAAARLPGLVEYLGQRTTLPAAAADPFAAIDAGEHLAIPAHARGDFTTALGLALGGIAA